MKIRDIIALAHRCPTSQGSHETMERVENDTQVPRQFKGDSRDPHILLGILMGIVWVPLSIRGSHYWGVPENPTDQCFSDIL